MLFLRFRPAAELLIDGKQLQFRELVSIFLRHIRIARAVEVLRRNLLAFRRVEILQVRFRHLARAFFIHHFVDHRDGRLSQNRLTRGHDFKLVFAQFVGRQQRFVFPGNQHIADAAFYEGIGRTTRAGVQHFHVFIQRLDEFLGFGLVAVILMQSIAPGCQIVPAGAAGAFRVRGNDRHARFDQVVPVMDLFRVALADEEHDG